MSEMRLIDANAVSKTLRNLPFGYTKSFAGQAALKEIENAPTIDAVPVVHGQWVKEDSLSGLWHKCSNCRSGNHLHLSAYCPDCGAKMDGQDANVPTTSDRGCSTCANDGYDMPQCRECTEHPGYPWYKRKDGGADE